MTGCLLCGGSSGKVWSVDSLVDFDFCLGHTGILRKVWNVFTCGKCCQGKTVYLKADLELVIDDIKMWGISSYNIFENP